MAILALGIAWPHLAQGGTFDFALPTRYWVVSDPGDLPLTEAIAIGDVTGDGQDDVVVVSNRAESATQFRVFVYGHQADGSLAPIAGHATGSSSTTLSLVDLDANGILDIVVGHYTGVDVLVAEGNGTFSASKIATGHRCSAVVAIDANHDSRRDIACLEWEGKLTVLHGDGAGGTAGSQVFHTYVPGWIDMKAGDVNGDGIEDIAITSMNSSSWYLHLGRGAAGLSPDALTFTKPGQSFSAVAIGDFNGDDRNDVAVATPGNVPDSRITLYFQDAAGELGPPVELDTLDSPAALLAPDVDGNGDADLLVAHDGWGSIGRYMQRDRVLASELANTAWFAGGNPQGMAVGDVDGDGCTDAAAVDSDKGFAVLLGICPSPVADFNQDRRSDVLWRNPVTGASALWSGAEHSDQLPIKGVSNLAWQVAGTGDVDGDGRADVVWREGGTGQNAVWLGGQHAEQQSISRLRDLQWTLAGIGDFDGDRVDDLLWRHGADGSNVVWFAADSGREHQLKAVTNTEWSVAGVADFDGDGADDLLWRNPVTGANTIWRSGDGDDQDNITDIRDTTWDIAGVGDFDADGGADILWRNSGNGRNVIWRGGRYADQAPVRRVGDTDWKVAAIGDYDGDGRDDILWRHASSGRNVYWAAAQSTEQHRVRGVTNLDWKVVP